MGKKIKSNAEKLTNNPGFALANPDHVMRGQVSDKNSDEAIKRWSFGKIDVNKGKDYEMALREKAQNLIGKDDAPLLDDDRRRHAIAKRLQREQQAASTMLTSGGNTLG